MTDFWRNKRVLVTGGAGFIGSHLVERLIDEGASVTVLDPLFIGLGGKEEHLSHLPKVRWLRFDMAHDSALSQALQGCELVFNLAGNVSHEDSMRMPSFDLAANYSSHLYLLEGIRRWAPQARVVYSSTRQVYGAPQTLPVSETHPLGPMDVNGIHKLACEQLHLLYHRVHEIRSVVLRLTNTFGPRMLIEHGRQGFIGWFLNRALLGEKIELFGGGKQRRDFTYVSDAVDALMLAGAQQNYWGEIFNLGGSVASLRDVAVLLKELAPNSRFVDVDFPEERKKIDVGDYFADSGKIEKALGWKSSVSLREGLSQSLDYFRTNSRLYLGRDL
jgi:UDP-glucose 4-epimerase